MELDGHGAQEGQHVRRRLGHLHPQQAQGAGQDIHQGDEEDPLAGHGDEGSSGGLADGLEHHVAHDNPAGKAQRDALEAQGHSANFNDLWVVPEQGDELGREGKAQGADRQKKAEGGLYAEPEPLLHPVVELRAVVEAADGLEALAEADHGGPTEHHDALDHPHGGDGRVAVGPGGPVQADGGHAGKALPRQRGEAPPGQSGRNRGASAEPGRCGCGGCPPWSSPPEGGRS